MKIDICNEKRINIESVKSDSKIIDGTVLNETLQADNKSVTMNSMDINRKGLIEAGQQENSFEEIKDKAQMLKNNFETMKNKMESGQKVDLDEDELDINNTEIDKIITVVERIQIKLAMYCDDFCLSGTGISMEDIKATMGDMVNTYKASAALDKSSISYLVKNKLEPTIDNVYKAIHSGSKDQNADELSDTEWNELKPQVDKIISDTGLESSCGLYDDCRYMVEQGMDLTAENLEYFETLNNLEMPSEEYILDRISSTLAEGRSAGQTKVTGESLPYEEAIMAAWVIRMAEPEHIMALSKQEEKTLDVLADIENGEKGDIVDEQNENYIKTYRKMQEIRLMMTLEAGRTMEKNGISINTLELSELVDKLKQYEAEKITYASGKSEDAAIKDVERVNEIMLVMEELKHAPAVILGEQELNENISPASLNQRRMAFAYAEDMYEALSTEVRPDLGDSINKAVEASMDDILSGLNYQDNEANRRAVRILAFNHMEMTADNLDRIKDLDISVNNLFRNMTPEKTLNMIRDGINPMETDVRELTDYFTQMDDDRRVEKYSEFLYRLEKNNSITPEEREKYIAIYSLINKIEKDGMNAAGSLMEQGLDLTMGNLLTAYMTLKSNGVDITADVNAGRSEIKDKVSYYRHLFSGIRNKVTPDALDSMSDMDDMSPEDFADKVKSFMPDALNEEARENLKAALNCEDDVIRFLSEYDIPSTPNNIIEVQKLIKKPEEIFKNNRGDKLLELVGSRDELLDEYDSLETESGKIMNETLYEQDKYLDVNSLRRVCTGMRIINNLAHKNNFYIPCRHNGKDMIINLKVVEDTEESGKFQALFENEDYGKVSIEGKFVRDGLNLSILSDNNKGIELIGNQIEEIQSMMEERNFGNIRINLNKSDEMPSIHPSVKNNTGTDKIFEAAKILISYFAN